MQIGMIGLGRMGANMVSRLLAGGHECIAYDVDASAVQAVIDSGANGASSVEELVAGLRAPRVVWIMVPAGAMEELLNALLPQLSPGDIAVDGGNSYYGDTMQRARAASSRGIHFIDVGTSGGVWGREAGYCQMIGGHAEPVARLEPVFEALACGESGRSAFLHCGTSGAGHYVKMVHNGIEYGLMQAYAEGLTVLKQAGGTEGSSETSAAPGFELDIAAITELWRHGSVVRSWLLDLIAGALAADPGLDRFEGFVADSGEGRWMLQAAVERGVPVPALTAALFARFNSQGQSEFTDRALAAMRKAFGGHVEPKKG
jgi:6-phosphogluconate dehydrogenase